MLCYTIENFYQGTLPLRWKPLTKSKFFFKNLKFLLYFKKFYWLTLTKSKSSPNFKIITRQLIQNFYFGKNRHNQNFLGKNLIFDIKRNFYRSLIYKALWNEKKKEDLKVRLPLTVKKNLTLGYYIGVKLTKIFSKTTINANLISLLQRYLLLNWVQINLHTNFTYKLTPILKEEFMLRSFNLYFFKIYNR